MRINHNISAMNTYRQLSANSNNMAKSMEKLSSGLRINRASDDAAGLAISEKMRAQIRGLDQASRNAQDSISLIQTAEGALGVQHEVLQRMRELAVQASNDTSTLEDRREIQKEMNQLIDTLDSVSTDTEFNSQKLLDGNFSARKFQVGANESQEVALTINKIDSTTLGVSTGAVSLEKAVGNTGSLDFATTKASVTIGDVTVTLDQDYSGKMDELATKLNDTFKDTVGVSVSFNQDKLVFSGNSAFSVKYDDVDANGATLLGAGGATETNAGVASTATLSNLKVATPESSTTGGLLEQTSAKSAITSINTAITQVSSERSKLGAMQNRLEYTINNLNTTSENMTSAESRIRDVDMAKEIMQNSKNNILAQASQAMLAQANQTPQGVLQLLR